LANTTLGGAANAAFTSGSQWPVRYSYNTAFSYITGSHHFKGGLNGTYGTFFHAVNANADLYQEYANVDTSAYLNGGGPLVFRNPVSVVVRNTPVVSGEQLTKDLGIYVQDTWTLRRLTVNAGIRYEWLNSGVQGLTAGAGRFVPERTLPEKNDLPAWGDPAPRFQVVYDVFGNSKTAVKYSANRYNAAQTTSIAASFNALASTTARINWVDVNGDDIAQGARTWNANGTYTDCAGYPSVGCEIQLSALRSNFGLLSDTGEYGGFPRQYSVEQGIEVQHELFPRLSITGSYYYGSFRNLTTTINRAITPADYTPVTIYNPQNGEPFTVYNQSAASLSRASDNITYVDPDRKQVFDSYSADFRFRGPGGINMFGGMSWERTRETGYGTVSATNNCTVGRLQNPNLLRFCDEFNLEDGSSVPHGFNVRLNASYPLPWFGLLISGNFQSNDGTGLPQSYTITRATVYPNGTTSQNGGQGLLVENQLAPACPSPCTAGSTVLPTLTVASLATPLRPDEIVRYERLNQLDLKIAKTFKVGRMTIAPNLEIFNVNNTDKVITYQSTSYAISTGSYLKPNSVVQGRIIGVGTSVRW
jgi:hypothetical protein